MKTLLEFDHKKATQSLSYLAKKEGGEINIMKAIKLIWLADRYHLRKYGRPIVNDIYYAMRYGPVCSGVKDLASFNVLDLEKQYLSEYLEKVNQYEIKLKKEIDEDIFSESDIEALDEVYKVYGNNDEFELAKITHEFPEWSKFEKVLVSGSSTREVMNYMDFFDDPANKDLSSPLYNNSEKELKLTKELFEENYEIANYWI